MRSGITTNTPSTKMLRPSKPYIWARFPGPDRRVEVVDTVNTEIGVVAVDPGGEEQVRVTTEIEQSLAGVVVRHLEHFVPLTMGSSSL